VIRAVVIGSFAVVLVLGCERAPTPLVAMPVRLPVLAATPPAPAPSLPSSEIPRAALAYRNNFLRIWRFYFALAESPSIGFGQVHQESRWNPNAQSAYASGIAQFTPATASDFAALLPPEVRATCPAKTGCPTDANWALHALSLYDFRLHRGYMWAATPKDRWAFVLASYNGGPGHIPKEQVLCERAVAFSPSVPSVPTDFSARSAGQDGRASSLAYLSEFRDRGWRVPFAKKVTGPAESSMQFIVTTARGAAEIRGSEVPRMLVFMVNEDFPRQPFMQEMFHDQTVDVLRPSIEMDGRVAVQGENFLLSAQSARSEYLAQIGGKACDRNRWFGHVERFCIRTPANCKENRHYPVVVFDRWQPLYARWLGL